MNVESILKEAVKLYGSHHQCSKLIEECCELSAAMIRYQNYPDDSNLNDLIEEIADVQIMLWQTSMIFDEKEINEAIFHKLSRLQKRMDLKKEIEQ